MTVENVVTARGVQKRYGSFLALESVDFEIRRGITGLLGANGAGKTTLLGMVLGLHKADAGSLQVFGIDPWTAGHKVRALIGYAPEHHVLSPHVKAADFVRHVAELHGLLPSEAAVRASDALWLVGLGEERFRPMGTMSTGQRQRVKLAQAIAHDPQLVILDEPTDGLDPIQRENMLQLIKTVSAEYGIDMILSSHLLEEVEMVCDNAVIIGEGRTLAWGSLDELQGSAEPSTELELDATDEQVAAIAATLGQAFDVSVASRHLTIRGQSADVSARVRDICVAEAVGIVRYAAGRRSLEDVYLERST